jgi:hypothetical protein
MNNLVYHDTDINCYSRTIFSPTDVNINNYIKANPDGLTNRSWFYNIGKIWRLR